MTVSTADEGTIGVDFADLVALFEYGRIQADGERYTASEPTDFSLDWIQQDIGCDLPNSLVAFAKACPAYTTYFALLGEDTDACGILYEPHVLLLHRLYPGNFVRLTQWRDNRAIAFQKSDPQGPLFAVEGAGGMQTVVEIAPTFPHYLEDFVISLALGDGATGNGGGRNSRLLDERERFVASILQRYD